VSAQPKGRPDFDTAKQASRASAGQPGPQFDAERDIARAGKIDLLTSTADERRWSPDDPSVLCLERPFDVRRQAVMPDAWYPELRSTAAEALAKDDRIRLGNEIIRWFLSGILQGEKTAFHLCAQLGTRLEDAAAREFMAVQAQEEVRHARAFSAYIAERWGTPYPVGDAFMRFLDELHATVHVDRKIVGMGILIEGFAMGALSNIRAHTLDPALARLLGHVLRDESVHHNFGTIWLEAAHRDYGEQEWRTLQRFARRGFQTLCLNLISIAQRRVVYAPFGLEWHAVRAAVRADRARPDRAPGLEEAINPLTVLARNLKRAKLFSAAERGRHRALDTAAQIVEA